MMVACRHHVSSQFLRHLSEQLLLQRKALVTLARNVKFSQPTKDGGSPHAAILIVRNVVALPVYPAAKRVMQDCRNAARLLNVKVAKSVPRNRA